MREGEFKKRILEHGKNYGYRDFRDAIISWMNEARKEFPDEDDSKFDTWENEDEMNIFNPDDYIKAVKEWLLRYFGEGEKK